MTEIKICGITRLDDALCALDAGADALGFIFHPPSPRCVTAEQARAIIAALPSHVVTVGVFVNETPERIGAIADESGIDLFQFHGDESPDDCQAFPAGRLIKALSPRDSQDLARLALYAVRAFLIDRQEAGLYGGTGRQADWGLAARLAQRVPLILAGGIREENCAEALSTVQPAAVDLNSGVERAPGIKDHVRLQRICRRIRELAPAGQARLFRKDWGEAPCGTMAEQGKTGKERKTS
jgi:phosphoribosylanthranilate isomerase